MANVLDKLYLVYVITVITRTLVNYLKNPLDEVKLKLNK